MDNISMQFKDFDEFKIEFENANDEVQFDFIRRLAFFSTDSKNTQLVYEILQEFVTNILPMKCENFNINFLIQIRTIIRYESLDIFEVSKIVINFLTSILDICEVDRVYQNALETTKEICYSLNNEQNEQLFMPMLKKLNQETIFDNGKCSLAVLLPICYKRITDNENKSEIRDMIQNLLQHESPIVRKAIVTNLSDFIDCVESEYVKPLFVDILKNINKETIDCIRILAVDVAISIARKLNECECKEFLLELILNWPDDSNWKMRQRLAFYIHNLQKALPYENLLYEVFSIYEKLIQDKEPEVRVVAVENLFNYCEVVQKIFTNSETFHYFFKTYVMPLIRITTDDSKDFVMEALSKTALKFTLLVNETCFITEILPNLLYLMNGKKSMKFWDNIFETLVYLPSDMKNMSELFKEVGKLMRKIIASSSFHWRTRRTILLALIHIAKICDFQFFQENLCTSYLYLCSDRVFAVRRVAILVLPVLAKVYGFRNIQQTILPYFLPYKDDNKYLLRLIPLYAITELIEPTLNTENNNIRNFLNDLKTFESKLKLAETLTKLERMTKMLRKKIEDMDLIQIEDFDYPEENIELYTETTLTENIYEWDIMKIDEDDFIYDKQTYLEGLLIVLLRDLFDVVENLLKDPIENVRTKAYHALNVIKNFLRSLENELKQTWADDSMKNLTNEQITAISNSIEEELRIVLPKITEENRTELFSEITSLINAETNQTNSVIVEEINDGLEMIEENVEENKVIIEELDLELDIEECEDEEDTKMIEEKAESS